MKLKELLELVAPKVDMTFEIIEETYPEGFYAKDILKKYPRAGEYKVVSIDPGVAYEDGKDVPTLMVEVTNKNDRV